MYILVIDILSMVAMFGSGMSSLILAIKPLLVISSGKIGVSSSGVNASEE